MMTAAEFRTARDSIGASAELVANLADKHVNSVWRWEAPTRTIPVPEDAETVLRGMLADHDAAVDALVAHVVHDGQGIIPRHVELDTFYALCPSVDGWGERVQGAVIAEAQRRLHMPVEYV